MIGFDEAVRFARLQDRLRGAIHREMRKGGERKAGDGAISISFCLPPVVGDECAPYWCVDAYSRLLNHEWRQSWIGKSAAEAISKAEDAIAVWCADSEIENVGALMGEPDSADDGIEF